MTGPSCAMAQALQNRLEGHEPVIREEDVVSIRHARRHAVAVRLQVRPELLQEVLSAALGLELDRDADLQG